MQLSEQIPLGGTMTTKWNPGKFGCYFIPLPFSSNGIAGFVHSFSCSLIYTEGVLFAWVFLRRSERKIKCWFQGSFSWDGALWNPDKSISDLCSASAIHTTACFSSSLSWKVWQSSRKSCLLCTSQQHAIHINNFRNTWLGMLTLKAHWCQHSLEEGSTLHRSAHGAHLVLVYVCSAGRVWSKSPVLFRSYPQANIWLGVRSSDCFMGSYLSLCCTQAEVLLDLALV